MAFNDFSIDELISLIDKEIDNSNESPLRDWLDEPMCIKGAFVSGLQVCQTPSVILYTSFLTSSQFPSSTDRRIPSYGEFVINSSEDESLRFYSYCITKLRYSFENKLSINLEGKIDWDIGGFKIEGID